MALSLEQQQAIAMANARKRMAEASQAQTPDALSADETMPPKPMTEEPHQDFGIGRMGKARELQSKALDTKTRAESELPEIGQGGVLHGLDIPTSKASLITAAVMSTRDPEEMGQILKASSPHIGIQHDEKGNVIAANNKTGARVMLNKPGLSPIDLIQTAADVAAFTPAGAAPSVLGRIALVGGTEAVLQGVQSAAGGEFNPEEVALSAALQGGGEAVVGAFRRSSALKDSITKSLKSGATDNNLAKYMLKGNKIAADKNAKEAIKQGFDEGVISAIKGASKTDRSKMLKMLNVMEKGKNNKRFSVEFRPSDTAGDSLLDRVRYIKKVNTDAGRRLDAVANTLRGKDVGTTQPIDDFVNALDTMGVKLNKKLEPVFQGSDIEGVTGAERAIKQIVKRLRDTKAPDAYDYHRLKRYIDEQVTYGKSAEGLAGQSERVLKKLRADIDGALDSKFATYDKVNTRYADTISVLDSIQSVTGSKLDMFGQNADKAIGTKLRGLMSNTQSRVNLMNAVNEASSVSAKYGGKFDDDIMTQMLFADELDSLFGTTARTSFAGETAKGVQRGLETAAGGRTIVGSVAEGVGALAERARGINDKNAFAAMRKILEAGK